MNWRRFMQVGLAAIMLLGLMSMSPGPSYAADNNPSHLFLLKDTKLYNSRTFQGKPAGVLKAHQFVTVVETDVENERSEPVSGYRVKTWLGSKWIKHEDLALLPGTYKKEDRTVTGLFQEILYDRLRAPDNGSRIAPQKLHVTAVFKQDAVNWYDSMNYNSQQGIWYQIDTPSGKKWLQDPAIPEDVKPMPVSYTLKLTGTETVYPYPFELESAAETIEPQVVNVVGEWTVGYELVTHRWYKIQLPQGARWIVPGSKAIKNYRELTGSITLPTETRYFDDLPSEGSISYPNTWLKPGDYEAIEASGDWVHIRTDKGEVWVNPKRALVERPAGIVPTDETIKLTKDSRYFRYANMEEEAHPKGFYAPKTVHAFEKRKAPDGKVFYHFTWNGHVEWVLLK